MKRAVYSIFWGLIFAIMVALPFLWFVASISLADWLVSDTQDVGLETIIGVLILFCVPAFVVGLAVAWSDPAQSPHKRDAPDA